MGNIMYTIALISVVSGIFELFSHSGKLKKYTSFAVSLCVVISLLTPVLKTLAALPSNLEINNGIFKDVNIPQEEDSLKEALKQIITEDVSSKMKIPKDVFYTEIDTKNENGEITVTSLTLYVTNKEYFRYCERIEAYIKSSYGCETKVIQHFKE